VNAMVRSAVMRGEISVHAGGEAYRPLIDVQDCAEAHVRFLEAEDVRGGIFNVAKRRQPLGNAEPLGESYTIACLALYIAHLLEHSYGYAVRVVGDWSRGEGRSYGMCCEAMREALKWEPGRGVKTMVMDVVRAIRAGADLDAPETRNIDWMTALHYGEQMTREFGSVF